MFAGKSLNVIVASVLARAPNFLLPILAVRVFEFPDYSVFALAFVTASALSAFLGEAIAATISRESYRSSLGKRGCASLAAFYRRATLLSYAFVVSCVSSYWLAAASTHVDRWLLGAATILLVPSYLLPAATTALANASSLPGISVTASLVGVPLSMVISFFLGARHGVAYYFVTYFACVVLTNLYVYFSVVSAKCPGVRYGGGETLREYGSAFVTILFPFMLGGPIHGFCLSILGRQSGGTAELAVYVAYYPWSLAVSVFAAILANYAIQTMVEHWRADDLTQLKRFLGRLILGNAIVALLISFCIWLSMDYVFAFYGTKFEQNRSLFNWMLVCGVGAACVSTTSQIIIGTGKGRMLVAGAVLHAVLYVGLTLLFVEMMAQGASGLIQSLSGSQFALALFHLVMIVAAVRQRAS